MSKQLHIKVSDPGWWAIDVASAARKPPTRYEVKPGTYPAREIDNPTGSGGPWTVVEIVDGKNIKRTVGGATFALEKFNTVTLIRNEAEAARLAPMGTNPVGEDEGRH